MKSLVCFLCISFGVYSLADEPLPLPRNYDFCHRNAPQVCAQVDTEAGTTLSYPSATGAIVTWKLAKWYRHLELSRDGKHVVTLYNGDYLLAYNDKNDDTVLLELWQAPTDASQTGVLLRQVRLAEFFTDLELLQPTVSHWYWGDVRRRFEEDGAQGETISLMDSLAIKTIDGRLFTFDMLTGALSLETP